MFRLSNKRSKQNRIINGYSFTFRVVRRLFRSVSHVFFIIATHDITHLFFVYVQCLIYICILSILLLLVVVATCKFKLYFAIKHRNKEISATWYVHNRMWVNSGKCHSTHAICLLKFRYKIRWIYHLMIKTESCTQSQIVLWELRT